jgi:N-acetylmuramoyl-L-alanine amidase
MRDKRNKADYGAPPSITAATGTEGAFMIGPRRAAITLLVTLPILLAGAGRHAAQSQEQKPAAAPAHSNCQPSAFRVVLDVGHTLDVPGAMSARNVPEYAFNLQLSQNIEQALVDAGFDKTVLLITGKPPPRGLVERASRANTMRADLFIAIHHDSVPDNLLQTWDYEGQQNNYNDDYPGYALFVSYDNADRAGSLQFGHLVGKALQANGLQYTPHYTQPLMGHYRRELVDADAGVYRFDELVVLRMTRMPAVLLEAGSIINRQEELELGTPERRAKTSAAIVAAVEDFCAARAHPKISQGKQLNPARAHTSTTAL